MVDERDTIDVTMDSVDFEKKQIVVDYEDGGWFGAGKYKLVPVKENSDD